MKRAKQNEFGSAKVGAKIYLCNCRHKWNNGLRVEVTEVEDGENITVKALEPVDGPKHFLVGYDNLTRSREGNRSRTKANA